MRPWFLKFKIRLVLGCFTGYSKRSTGCLNGCESGEAIIRRSSSLHRPRHAFTSKTMLRLEFWLAACQEKSEDPQNNFCRWWSLRKIAGLCWSVVPLTLCPVDVPGVSESTSKSPCGGIKMDIFEEHSQDKQAAGSVKPSPWPLPHCWYHTLVCDTGPRCLCSSGPWSQWSTSCRLRTDWKVEREAATWHSWDLTLCNVGEHPSPL